METVKKSQVVQKGAEGGAYGIAVMLPWLVGDVLGYGNVPPEVLNVGIVFMSMIAARIRDIF